MYNLSGLSEGSHSLTLKAWDNFNNSSEKSILFLVESGEKFILKNLINYPNPFLMKQVSQLNITDLIVNLML